MRTVDYDGVDVIGADGDKIGTVEQSYADDTGVLRFVEVKIGSLFGKHRLVPAGDAYLTDAGLQVPYTAETIKNSPDAGKAGHSLDGSLLDQARGYYNDVGGARPAVDAQPAGTASSSDDDVSDS